MYVYVRARVLHVRIRAGASVTDRVIGNNGGLSKIANYWGKPMGNPFLENGNSLLKVTLNPHINNLLAERRFKLSFFNI